MTAFAPLLRPYSPSHTVQFSALHRIGLFAVHQDSAALARRKEKHTRSEQLDHRVKLQHNEAVWFNRLAQALPQRLQQLQTTSLVANKLRELKAPIPLPILRVMTRLSAPPKITQFNVKTEFPNSGPEFTFPLIQASFRTKPGIVESKSPYVRLSEHRLMDELGADLVCHLRQLVDEQATGQSPPKGNARPPARFILYVVKNESKRNFSKSEQLVWAATTSEHKDQLNSDELERYQLLPSSLSF